jgi:hypothetical protein
VLLPSGHDLSCERNSMKFEGADATLLGTALMSAIMTADRL